MKYDENRNPREDLIPRETSVMIQIFPFMDLMTNRCMQIAVFSELSDYYHKDGVDVLSQEIP